MPARDETLPAAGTEKLTLDADALRQAGDSGDLGMVLTPSVEDAAERFQQRSQTPSTLPWPAVSNAGSVVPGTNFGPYVLMEEVGRGGMGVVYKARHKGLDRIVAVKMILANHLAGADQIERFYAEARAAARLQDPRIVAIHDVGQIAGQHFFAMEYIAGPSLAQVLKQGPLADDVAARTVLQVARAIGRLHKQGVVHRDLKPSNILLDEHGNPLVTDFGLAKMLAGGAPSTRTGAIVGTPSYMAPEQAAGRSEEVGPLSDVYALGAILYELLTGRPPFDEANPLDTLVQVIEGEPEPPCRLRPGLPRNLEQICLKCLEKGAEARYASADDLADDLERHLRGEPVEARRLTPWQRLGRWSRREPALVSRLCTLAIFASVVQINQLLNDTLTGNQFRQILVLTGLGAAASLIFQALLTRERWSRLARYTWATADMILFSTLAVFNEGLGNSPLVAGYFVLVAASGLWFRERLVWYTTGLAVLSYVLVILFEGLYRQNATTAFQQHLVLLIAMVATGFVVGYQVRRVRALSRYYENRPLP